MPKTIYLAGMATALVLGFAANASAAPLLPTVGDSTSLVEKARADCKWVNNKWTYRKGDKTLVCRPDRPSGKGWVWHKEGNRFGWWNPKRKSWGFNGW